MTRKKIVGAVLAVVAAASMLFSGCAADIDPSTTVATIGETKLTYGEANFMLRMQQATYDTYYRSYYGADMWDKDMTGEGKTLGETVKTSTLESIRDMIAADVHKSEYNVDVTDEEMEKIKTTAQTFMNKNSSKVSSGFAITREEDVVEILRLYTIKAKVSKLIKDTADKNVSDEEAAQRSFSFVSFNIQGDIDENGESVEITDEKKEEIRKTAAKLLEDAKAGGDFEELAKAAGQNVTKDNYGKDDDGTVEAVRQAADKLKEGEFADLIEADGNLFVIRLDKEFDREATDEKKKTIVTQREQAKLEEVTKPWTDALEIKPVEEVWSKVGFNRAMGFAQ